MPIQMNAETVEFCKKEIHDLPVKKLIRNSKSPLVLCCFIYISALCNPLGLFGYCVHRSNNCKGARMARKYSSTEKS